MAFKLKLPGFMTGTGRNKDQIPSATTIMENLTPPPKEKRFEIAFLRQYSVVKQLQILGTTLIVLMAIIAAVVYHDNRESTYNTVYVATAGEMQMLSQRLAKASSLILLGDPRRNSGQGSATSDVSAFAQLTDTDIRFWTNLDRLSSGGELFGQMVPESPAAVQPALQALEKIWQVTSAKTRLLNTMEPNLLALVHNANIINSNNARLFELTEQIATQALQSNAGPREVAAANHMVMLSQRIAKNTTALQIGDEVSAEVAFMLGKDIHTFRELLTGLMKGNETLRVSASTDSDTRKRLSDLADAFAIYETAGGEILGDLTKLTAAKQAGATIFRNSDELLDATNRLAQAYQRGIGERLAYGISLAVLIAAALATLLMMAKVYLDDSRHQAEIANEARIATEAVNRQNQDAILRLMNELGDLADGDLTVMATVSEDITGAIADSINYTVEELRVLVGRINDAAGRVTHATEIAQLTSAELIDAAERQSTEIQAAGHSVLTMASSMSKVSTDANQSAQVARQSLAAAGKGAQAVEDSIKGMNEIRDQIQETSKRIKRLGESSQEIGEIVELISDITEQTNVLALNAAIQAASAGDAGRGFTVVAEEVQRLAERSAEATKQIAAIVKTIQTDTQGAVSAMEESTRGVVAGARLSDAAGQALAEIGEVSRNLTVLIENITEATRQQAESATGVASKMQGILRITEQTTAGTQKTAVAVGELAGLATELKGSVAGFKVG